MSGARTQHLSRHVSCDCENVQCLPFHALTMAGEPYEADLKPLSSTEVSFCKGRGGGGGTGSRADQQAWRKAQPGGSRAPGLEVFGLG